MSSLVGSTVDKYAVLEEVGHGGMAVVYRGRDPTLEREVAIKVLHAHLADREESRLRLRREALAVAKLHHENILEIFDYSGPEAGASYIITEFIHGPTLKEWLDTHAHPRPALAAMIIYRLCQALCHAHRSGIIHRDIKPENVMIRAEDGCVKLMDFGIAQILDNQKLTMTGQLLGSPAYMAPELIGGRPLDARTDLFSMGILLYQLATGELPFSGRNPHEVLNRIADGECPPPSTLNALVDPDLEAIICRTLRVNPEERYQSAEALAAELGEYLAEMGLQPTNAELARYFRNPEAYVEQLDARVSGTLMERAEAAANDGYHSRAIRLLGRVLELDRDHEAAAALLNRLRRRERRTRQLLVGVSMVALTGLVAAGVILFRPQPVADQVEARAQGSPQRAERRFAAAAPRRSEPEPEPEQAPQRPDSTPTAVDSVGRTRPSPAKPRRQRRTRRAPRRKPIAAPTTCTIRLDGVPAAAARSLQISWSDHKEPVQGLRHDIAFEQEQEKVRVKVESPRYGGSSWVRREDCSGDAPVVVPVSTKPAQLAFRNAPDGLVVRCLKGCPQSIQGVDHDAASFPAIPMNGPLKRVQLAYKHEDYQQNQQWVRLSPGLNPIRLSLEPY